VWAASDRFLAEQDGLGPLGDDRPTAEPFASDAPARSCARPLVDLQKPAFEMRKTLDVLRRRGARRRDQPNPLARRPQRLEFTPSRSTEKSWPHFRPSGPPRTGEGRKRAKERGVRFGRPRKMTPHQQALRRLAAGETQADVARTYAVDAASISRLAAASPFGQRAVGDLR